MSTDMTSSTATKLAVFAKAPAGDERTVPLDVSELPRLPAGRGTYQPDTAVILYKRRQGEDWRVWVQISGHRALTNGALGQSRVTRTYWRACDTDPAYPSRPVLPEPLIEVVDNYWPGGRW